MITLNELRVIAQARFPNEKVGFVHMLISWGMDASETGLTALLQDTGINTQLFVEKISYFLLEPEANDTKILISCIQSVSGEEVNGIHLLQALCNNPDSRLTISLIDAGMDCKKTLSNIQLLLSRQTVLSEHGIHIEQTKNSLLQYGRDMTALAAQGAFNELFERDHDINRMIDVLLRKRKGNPILTGPAGVGKTALVELLSLEIVKNIHPSLTDYHLFEISLGQLVAGTKYRGDFEGRFEQVMTTLIEHAPAILFLDEIHILMGSGRAEGVIMDGANMIKPFLARDNFKVIGATTASEYHRFITTDEALARRFQQIRLKEPDSELLMNMVLCQAKSLSEHHGIEINEKTVSKAIKLTDRYLTNRNQPDKSIDLLDSSAVAVRRKGGKSIEGDQLLKTLSILTDLPVGTLSGEEKISLRNLANKLKQRVIGQNEAIKSVVETIIHRRMDIGNDERPLSVFLFAGDTGIGKTELARAIAHTFLGSPNKLVHLDLGEFSGEGGVYKLIGSPPGYIGSDRDGALITGLQTHPACVLLFDEIEKADPKVYDLLLGLLDNGRITSNKDERYDARQCIIIMTTNAVTSSDLNKKSIGFGTGPSSKSNLHNLLSQKFPIEFLGRIDEIIAFNNLTENDLRKIMKLRLNEAVARLLDKGIHLVYKETQLIDYLFNILETEKNGARDIARTLERRLLQPLAMALLNSTPEQEITIELDDLFYEKQIISF